MIYRLEQWDGAQWQTGTLGDAVTFASEDEARKAAATIGLEPDEEHDHESAAAPPAGKTWRVVT